MENVSFSGFRVLLLLQKQYKYPQSYVTKNCQNRKNHFAVFDVFFIFFKKNAVLTAKYEIVGYKNLKGVVGSELF